MRHFLIFTLLVFFTLSGKAQKNPFIDSLFIKLGFSIGDDIPDLNTLYFIKVEPNDAFFKNDGIYWEYYNYSYKVDLKTRLEFSTNRVFIGLNAEKKIGSIFIVSQDVNADLLIDLIGKPNTVASLPTINGADAKLMIWEFNGYCISYTSGDSIMKQIIIYDCDPKSIFKLLK